MHSPQLLLAVLTLLFAGSSTLQAAETGRWSVRIDNATAILQATPETHYRFIAATIAAERESGIRQFSLKAASAADLSTTPTAAYTVKIVDDTAEINASADLPYRHLAALLNQLRAAGVKKMRFAAAAKQH